VKVVQRIKKVQLARAGKSRAVVGVGLFAVIGLATLIFAHAATSYVSIEPESGTGDTNVTIGTDAAASGQGYTQFHAPVVVPTGNVLSVNAAQAVAPFNKKMKGIGLANWTFTKNWGKPFVGQVQPLPQAISVLDPGLIRYAGGLWANWVGFDRNKVQATPHDPWTFNGKTYYFNYGTDELASLDSFAKSVNAQVMIQVNVSNDDPSMWADMVRYAKEQGYTSLTSYEFANELDLATFTNADTKVDPDTYATRVAAYQTAMLAADPTITFVGGVPATASDIMRQGYNGGGNVVSTYITKSLASAKAAGHPLQNISYHWYQNDGNSTNIADVLTWSNNTDPSKSDFWGQSYSREWSQSAPKWIDSTTLNTYPNTQQGISELGINSESTGVSKPTNGNHIGALWYSDVLGRLAYNGVDWVTQWDSYASSGEAFSLLYPDSDSSTTPTLHLRPTYYAYAMYSKYFGDQLVQSTSYDQSKISVWASKDSKDAHKLKLRITNMSPSAITVPITVSGFTPTTAGAYVMASTNPTDNTTASTTDQAPTTINGVKLNAASVAASLAAIAPVTVGVSGNTLSFTYPAYSSTAVVVLDN
jgi:hypothetical protein